MERLIKFDIDGHTLYMYAYEGTGDNLWDEDIEDGYVDYINYELYEVKLECGEPVFKDYDSGMVLCDKYCADMTEDEFIGRALDMAIGDVPYTVCEEVGE